MKFCLPIFFILKLVSGGWGVISIKFISSSSGMSNEGFTLQVELFQLWFFLSIKRWKSEEELI